MNTEELTVEEYTTPYIVSIEPEASLDEALELMQEHDIRHLPVMKGDELKGIVSQRDLLTHSGKSWAKVLRIEDIMSLEPLMVYANDKLSDVAYQLSSAKIGSAIVLDEESKIFGIFTTTDALNALVEIHYNKEQLSGRT